jgi:hypothetical protein
VEGVHQEQTALLLTSMLLAHCQSAQQSRRKQRVPCKRFVTSWGSSSSRTVQAESV